MTVPECHTENRCGERKRLFITNVCWNQRGTNVFISVRTNIKRRYESIPKKESRIVLILGIVLFFTSLMLIPSTIISYQRDDESIWPYLVPMVIGLVLSTYMCMKYKLPNNMRPADGLMMMFSVWILLFAFGTIPYLMLGMSLIDSIFESISGFTTTGATILTDVAAQPKALLLWRVITNWIGGIIIVMMFMFIIPMVISGGRGLLKNEMSGSGGGNLTMKLGNAARQFIAMYIILTALFALILLVQDLSLLDSVTIAMSSISIGGFLNTNDSMASYSMFVKISVIFFMIISASNFYLHYRALFKGDIRGYGRSEEFKVMILWFLIISVLIIIQAFVSGSWDQMHGQTGDKIVDVVFSVVSVGTTSGFSTVNYTTYWTFLNDLSLFMILMFIGGSTGSTSGGVKISRMIITLKALLNEIRQEVHPNAVYTVRYDGSGISHDAVHTAMVVVTAFIVAAGVGAAIFNIYMDTLDEAVFTALSMITNTGTGSGDILFNNYADLPAWMKLVSCGLMFLGRMEILAILAIFTPGFWVEFVGRGGINNAKSKLSISKRIKGLKKKKSEGDAFDAEPEDVEEIIIPEPDE